MTKTIKCKGNYAPIYASNILLAALVKIVFLCSPRGFLWRRLASFCSGAGVSRIPLCVTYQFWGLGPSSICQMAEGITCSSLLETFIWCKIWAGFNSNLSFSWFQEYETKEDILSWFKCGPLPEGLLIWLTYPLQGIWFFTGSAILANLCWWIEYPMSNS